MSKEPSSEIILYQRDDAPAIDVRLDGETVWMSQKVICRDFRQVDSSHNGSDSVVADFTTTDNRMNIFSRNLIAIQAFTPEKESR